MSTDTRRRLFRVSGFSMWPLLRDGDDLRTEPLTDFPALGTVLVFRLDGRLVCHRYFGTDHDGEKLFFRTRGDAHYVFDGPVAPGAVVGRVTAIENSRGRTYLNDQLGPALTKLFLLRDAVMKRLRLSPGSPAFSVVYMAMAPWLFWRPAGCAGRVTG